MAEHDHFNLGDRYQGVNKGVRGLESTKDYEQRKAPHVIFAELLVSATSETW